MPLEARQAKPGGVPQKRRRRAPATPCRLDVDHPTCAHPIRSSRPTRRGLRRRRPPDTSPRRPERPPLARSRRHPVGRRRCRAHERQERRPEDRRRTPVRTRTGSGKDDERAWWTPGAKSPWLARGSRRAHPDWDRRHGWWRGQAGIWGGWCGAAIRRHVIALGIASTPPGECLHDVGGPLLPCLLEGVCLRHFRARGHLRLRLVGALDVADLRAAGGCGGHEQNGQVGGLSDDTRCGGASRCENHPCDTPARHADHVSPWTAILYRPDRSLTIVNLARGGARRTRSSLISRAPAWCGSPLADEPRRLDARNRTQRVR